MVGKAAARKAQGRRPAPRRREDLVRAQAERRLRAAPARCSERAAARCEALERIEAHESIGRRRRLIPAAALRTPARCKALKSSEPPPAVPTGRGYAAIDGAHGPAIGLRAWMGRRLAGSNGRRATGVERRYGFARREKL